jgi:hypothetical protein
LLGKARHPFASSLPRTAALVAICAGLLALPAQAGAANPVTHALDVLDATATRQLAPVAKAVADVPLPAPVTADSVAGDVAQTADAVPQEAAATTTTVRSSVSDTVERARAAEPAPDASSRAHAEALSSSVSRNLPEPSATSLASSTRINPPVRAAQILSAARAIVPTDTKRVTSALARATANVPTARDLNARASQLAGALIGAVDGLVRSAQTVLAAIPTIGVPTTPQPLAAVNAAKATTTATTPLAIAEFPRSTQLVAASSEASGATKSIAPAAPELTRPPMALGAETIRDVAHLRGTPSGPAPGVRASAGVGQASVADGAPGEPRAKPLSTTSAASSPSPSPSPGGVSPSGGAAIGGASLTTFLAVFGLLLLAGPRSLRRIRLAAASLRATQFALIPERPG